MQVKIEVSPKHTPPRVVMYTDRITPEIQRALDILQAGRKNRELKLRR